MKSNIDAISLFETYDIIIASIKDTLPSLDKYELMFIEENISREDKSWHIMKIYQPPYYTRNKVK